LGFHSRGFRLIQGFPQVQADYPPLALLVISITGKLAQFSGVWVYLAIKITLFCFLSITTFVFWLWTKNFFLSLLLYFSLMINSITLGHLDILFAPTLLLAFWALSVRKWGFFSCAFTVSFLTKWQPLIIAPFIALYLLDINKLGDWKKIDFKGIIKRVVIPCFAIISVIFIFFGIKPILEAFLNATNHAYVSGNALNLNWVITHFLHVYSPQQFGPLENGQALLIRTLDPKIRIAPHLLFILAYLITLIVFFKHEKSFENLVLFALLGYIAYFMLNPGVHENHLFIAMILSIILFWINKENLFPMIFIILVGNINLLLFNGMDGMDVSYNRTFIGVDLALVYSLINLLLFAIFWCSNIFRNRKKLVHSQTIPAN